MVSFVNAAKRFLSPTDTLDLQPREKASAADHTNAPDEQRDAQGFAPHQSNTLRSAEEEEKAGTLHEEDEVDRDLAGSESLTGDEGGYDDDDDMGDRMSSSPSIADGVYFLRKAVVVSWILGGVVG